MPPNPKRSPSRRGEPQFKEGDILRADDPRPQHVAQYPASSMGRRRKNEEAIPTSVYDTDKHDEELKASYDGAALESGMKPAFLYVEKGPGAGQLVQVRQGVLVIGRASVSDLRLQHPSISRRHAQLTRRGERFYFKDLGSQNGTFVNKERIEGEVELVPGDAIGMGNALLKLRGPLAKNETIGDRDRLRERQRVVPTAVVTRPRSSGVVKVAMFAGAVGFGLAAVLAFALFRSPSSGKGDPKKTVAAAGAPTSARPSAQRRFQAEPATDEIEIAAGPLTVTRERRIDDAIEKKMAERKAAMPAAKAEESAKAEAPATAAEAVAAKKASPTRAAAAKDLEKEAAPEKPTAKRATLLASYEKGDAEASLEAAREAGDKALTAQLQKFVDTYDAGEAAFVKNDARTAIARYEAALKLDEQISSGWSSYGADIRKKLAGIYLLAGTTFSRSGQTDNARTALQAALKYEPGNAKAKSALKELGGGDAEDAAAAPAPKKAAASKRAAADDAFGDEEAAPKKAAKKAPAKESARSAIDDAFGD